MNNTFLDRNPCITVAVGFDEHTIPLTQAAVRLCRQAGKKLCLLHVVEPWTELPKSKPFGAEDPLWNTAQAVDRDARDVALAKLDELAATVPPEVSVQKLVATGKPVEVLAREALNAGTALLMVGANFDNLKYVPRGFSTALSLMVSSPVPVLVADARLQKEIIGERTRLLVADDLGEQSETAVETAFALGAALGKCDLHHVHVNGLTFDSLKAGLVQAAAASHTPVTEGTTAESVYAALERRLGEQLAARAENQREYLEAAGGGYFAEILTGNVADEIARVVKAVEPHILVFGRHHAYYTKPFFIGRVPYRAMLAQKRPILVVPNE